MAAAEEEIFAPDPGTGRRFRTALGRFATGVTVITTHTECGSLGITANSFASLSLDPPLVLWSPARASRRFSAFVECSHMAIHVLAAEQGALAEHFARRAATAEVPGVTDGIGGVPLLPGVLTRLECAVEAVHPGGDHAIVVGRVLRVATRPGRPLVFHDGRFVTLGSDGAPLG
ncbi:MAG: flavin reductase family protein [Rhodobacteraceae bacterium]|nr:flavin reductase family protein [Paracoccaceae bacterium]